MQARTMGGPNALSMKYDLLTAIGCYALAQPAGIQRLVLRFLTLITARYNWRYGVLRVGQREIARLWSVDERTVKREMSKLRALGWITLESPARRGRVASYALDLTTIRATTRNAWPRVGVDFDSRMTAITGPSATVVPFPGPGPAHEVQTVNHPEGDDPWSVVRGLLRAEDPVVFANWFEPLRSRAGEGEAPLLVAPNAFHASHIRTHYADRLRRALRRAGRSEDFRIISETVPVQAR
ncbi:DnaA N-terminal domain-containing protein [Amaricoccus sp. W119]|uniref:DnaA N-terminal domain-containing protein n=1 Tax=Amaricoccus sp. W119 TaxID=3391833 RepID=UPI0039A5D214